LVSTCYDIIQIHDEATLWIEFQAFDKRIVDIEELL
jgi:hypothetical protein